MSITPSPHADASSPPGIVIDTQVLMDWMVFKNLAVAPLVTAVCSGRVTWLATDSMRDEMRHVLARGVAAAYQPDFALIEQLFDRHAQICAAAAVSPRLVCRDRDDQKFIDLALERQARWLVSRDKAVLALTRRARPRGLSILKPEAWIKEQSDLASDGSAPGQARFPPGTGTPERPLPLA